MTAGRTRAKHTHTAVGIFAAFGVLLLVATVLPIPSTFAASATIRGSVMGGLSGISGCTITLYAAGTTGYGSAPSVLGSNTSGSSGNFSITYARPAPSSEVYLVATGGSSGSGSNSAIALMSALGKASSLPNSYSVTVNELTTAASAWSMSRFVNPTNTVNLGTSATNITGLLDAHSGVELMTDPSTGGLGPFMPAPSSCTGSGQPPNCATEKKLDELADMMVACVQSEGPSASFPGDCPSVTMSSASCDQLLCYAGATSAQHANTLQAAVNMALHPLVVSPLSHKTVPADLVNSDSPFQPTPTSAPNDLTLALNLGSGDLRSPVSVAIDASNHAWVTANNPSGVGAVFEYDALGDSLSGMNGFTGGGLFAPNGIAIDRATHVWIANSNGSVTKLDSAGSPLTGASGITGGGLNASEGVAIDSAGNVWVTNEGNSTVTELNSAGSIISGPDGYGGGGLKTPHRLAIDRSNNVWIANGPKTGGSVTELISNGSAISPSSGYTGGGLDGAHEIEVDPKSNVWATNRSNSSVTKLNSSGAPLSPASGYTAGGITSPNGIAMDSAGEVFVANQFVSSTVNGKTVSELNPSGAAISPATGFSGPAVNEPHGLAIDLSGNLWVVNQGGATVTVFYGLAAPVKTPLIGPPKLP
jgi:sugar lactone lactonase YvrE